MKREHKEEMKARARNIAMIVAYDGTGYHGFQRQTPPIVAVQNVLEEKLQLVFGDRIELAAAGRTDAGVHASGQVVNFFTNGRIPTERIIKAVNSLLPDDIAVQSVWEADHDFSARHSAKSKTYLYRLHSGKTPDPLLSRYCWHIEYPLSTSDMSRAMGYLEGVHDFSAFRASGGAPMSPVREMYDAKLSVEGAVIMLRFHASGFLYHMARNIVGTRVRIGEGLEEPDDIVRVMESHDRSQAAATAPARGLLLEHVEY